MKKIIAFCIAVIMGISTASVAFAAPPRPGAGPGMTGLSNVTDVEFYVSRWGVQWDSEGDIQTRSTEHFSSCVGETKLKEKQNKDFAIALGAETTEEEILSYVKKVPDSNKVFKLLKKEFKKAKLYDSNGKEVDWKEFTTDIYRVEWYVLKNETNSWHIDGRLIEIETDNELNIVFPDEEDEFKQTEEIEELEQLPPSEEPTPEPPVEEDPEEEPVPEPPVEEEPVPEPPVEEDTSISLTGVTYAYIFGYEPIITESYDEEGNLVTTAQIEMGMDDSVTVEQVSSMLMRMLDQTGKTMNREYPITPAVEPHRGQWYERGLAYLCSVGGFDADEVIKIAPITRGQVAKLVACALKLNLSEETPFDDIEGNIYKEYIEKVYKYGYMHGVSSRAFNPDGVMTRAEFCALFNNIIDRNSFGLVGLDEDGNEIDVTAETYYFVDMNPSHWAYEICLKASSAYDENGYVDIKTRNANIRNKLDKYDSQKKY